MKGPSPRPVKRLLAGASVLLATIFIFAFEQPAVRVSSTGLAGPRPLEDQTRTALVRDYLAAWQSMDRALGENDASLLDADFVGVAKEKLSSTIEDQQKLGLRTRYQDRSHDVQLVFYSPEGLSIQLLDTVEYDVQLMDHDRLKATQQVRARYLAVLTPTEVRWKVRIFQALPQ